MSKQKVSNKVQVKLAVVPPLQKTWQTPTYHLDHSTIRRHTRVVSIQLIGVRGNEKRTESISLPLVPGITDSDYIRAAVWFSPNKWQVNFSTNVSQFGGKFSQPVDAQLIQTLMHPATQGQRQQPELHNAPTIADTSAFQPQFLSPTVQPGQFRQISSTNRLITPSQSTTRGGFKQWYHTRSRSVKVGLWSVAVVAILMFVSIVGTAIGSSTPTTVPVASPISQAAAPTPTAPLATIPTTQPSPTQTRATPTPTVHPTVVTIKPTPIPPTPTPCPGVNCNPWGYNFTPGNLIYTPPSDFCAYFNCISSFYEPDDPDNGYVVECSDGTYSQSGGERGACSYHGGVSRPLYSH